MSDVKPRKIIIDRKSLVAKEYKRAPDASEAKQDVVKKETGGVGIVDDEPASPVSLTPRSYLQLLQPVDLLTTPQPNGDDDNALGRLPDGAIVQVLTRQDPAGDQSRWVKLKICAVDLEESQSGSSALTVTPPAATSLTSGAEGWVLEAQLAQIVRAAPVLNCPSD